jgi:DNA (cytosine-5)-methyltransferase 1
MTHGSLFSGIGGFDLAAEWVGWENIFQVEIDDFCQKVLTKNFPNVTRYKDIKEFDGTIYRNTIDVISGGFPCQPFSKAGKQRGKNDDRYLWPEMLRIVREIKPAFVVCENVTGIVKMVLKEVCISLEDQGYEVEIFNLPACSVQADHIRERIWILAYSGSKLGTFGFFNRYCQDNREIKREIGIQKIRRKNRNIIKMGTEINYGIYEGRQFSESKMVRISNGLSSELDEIRSLGNAIVPQIAFEIFKVINQIYKQQP